MSSEPLALAAYGSVSLNTLPASGAVSGDVFRHDGTQWQITANDNNNPMLLPGISAPGAPASNTGVLYKQTSSDGLWWRTDGASATDLTTAHVTSGLNVFTVNTSVAVSSRNYHTVQTAVTAAEATLPTTGLGKAVIYVTAGTYTENVTIARRVELHGVGSGARGYYLASETGDAEIRGTVTANSPCVLENLILNPVNASVSSNIALSVGAWLTNTVGATYNPADDVVCHNCVFASSSMPSGSQITNSTDQTARGAGKRANVKLYECIQTGDGQFASLSYGNTLYMYRSTSVGVISINPIAGTTTGNTSVLIARDSVLQQVGTALPTIIISGTTFGSANANVDLLRCQVSNNNSGQIPISAPAVGMTHVIVIAKETEITTGNATAISLAGATTSIYHSGLWSGNISAVPALVAATVTAYGAIV